MELNLRAGCWKNFVSGWQKWYALIIIAVGFISLLMNRYYDRLLPLLRQILLLPNRSNKFMNLMTDYVNKWKYPVLYNYTVQFIGDALYLRFKVEIKIDGANVLAVQCFVDRESWYILTTTANRMHYLLSIYFNN